MPALIIMAPKCGLTDLQQRILRHKEWYEQHCVPKKKPTAYRRRKHREQTGGPGWTDAEWIEHRHRLGDKCLCCSAIGVLLVPDHVIPLRRGGKHDLSNIQPLCLKCNFSKGMKIIDYR